MAPLSLTAKLHAALPWVSPQARAILTSLAACNGGIGSAEHLARVVALRNRFRLARLLRRDGLPPVGELAAWTRVLYWLHQAEADESPLARLALADGLDPATASRLVKRVLGITWTMARGRGFQSAFDRFVAVCHRRPVALIAQRRASTVMRPGTRLCAHGKPGYCSGCAPGQPREVRASEIGARVPLAGQPFDVAVSRHGAAYVTCGHGAVVQWLDLDAASPGRAIPVGSVPSCVAFSADGLRAYVTNQFSSTVGVIDVKLHRQVDEIALPGDPVPLLLDPDQVTVHVTTNQDALLAVDLASHCVTRRLPLPATSHHLALHPDGERLYVATRAAGTVLEVNRETYRILRRFDLGGMPQGLAVLRSGTRLLVANEGGLIQYVDLTGGRVAEQSDLGSGGFSLAVSPGEDVLYVGLPAAGLIRVFDAETLAHRGVIDVGGVPRGLAFDLHGRQLIAVNEAGWVDLVRPVRGKGSAAA
jgi:YVTN family beta-propeller protein